LKVKLERSFPLPAAADAAWRLLQDIEQVGACMPGASITARIDERHYKGTVTVRFGPASLVFRGELEVAALEAATRTLRLLGKGTDGGGGSAASLDLTARVDPLSPQSCNLVGNSEVSMSGKAASFGARMAETVAEQVLRQFAANFAQRLQSAVAATAPAGAGAAPASGAGAKELNGLALLWGMILGWLRALFAPKRA
jgi:uncharacterized protein